MKYGVFLKDTDPDTGATSQFLKMCECDTASDAKLITLALSNIDNDDPNRDYYFDEIYSNRKTKNLVICVDPDQIELAFQCQTWLAKKEVRPIICFSIKEFEQVSTLYLSFGSSYMATIVGKSDQWNNIDCDLRLSEFSEDDFETIYSAMT